MGSVQMRHLSYDDKKQRIYLSKEPNPRKAPLSAYLQLSGAIALLHYDTIYILSGNKSGTVYYFRPLSFARMGDASVVPFTVKKMNYARFFGCHNEDQGSIPEALQEDLIVHNNVSETSFGMTQTFVFILIDPLFLSIPDSNLQSHSGGHYDYPVYCLFLL